MREYMVVDKPRQIKAVADDKRMHLLDILVEKEATVGQLAAMVNEPHAKVHYHVKELERNGMVEMTREAARAGAPEKFYRAAARTFLLGFGLGRHGMIELAAREAAETDLLRRRREDILGVDFLKVARMIVSDCLAIRPGERVLVEGGPHQMELLEALVFEVWRNQGDAVLQVMGDDLLSRTLRELPDETLAGDPVLRRDLYRHIDTRIAVDPFADEAVFGDIPEEKIGAWRCREEQALDALKGRTGRTLWLGFPTPALASLTDSEYMGFHDAFWTALAVSPAKLSEAGRNMAGNYVPGQSYRVLGERTHLRFVPRREPRVLDGRLEPEAGIWRVEFLPAGEVQLDLADSAEGVFSVRDFVYAGHPVRDVRLFLERGKLTGVTSSSGQALLQKVLASKGASSAGTLHIGVNPAVTAPLGYELLDAVSRGTVSIGLSGPYGRLAFKLAGEPVRVVSSGDGC